jgi:hypothetical protein
VQVNLYRPFGERRLLRPEQIADQLGQREGFHKSRRLAMQLREGRQRGDILQQSISSP